MKTGLIILFVLIIIAGIACAAGAYIKAKKNAKNNGSKGRKGMITGGAVALVSLILMIMIPCQLYEVRTGEVAVVRKFGEVSRIEQPGLKMRNIFSEKIEMYPTFVQQLDFEKWAYVQDTRVGSGDTSSNTTQVIQIVASMQFTITDASKIASEFGSMDNLKNQFSSKILGILETSAAGRELTDLLTGQGKQSYQIAVTEAIREAEAEYYVSVRQVIIEEFVMEDALEAALLKVRLAEAERRAQEEAYKQETEKVKQEAIQAEEKARAEREIALQKAQNDVEIAAQKAQEALALAQGEADALLALAKAEAEQLRLKTVELARSLGINIIATTDGDGKLIENIDNEDPNISKLASYLQTIEALNAWDGKLPETLVVGDGDFSILKILGLE